MGMSTAELQSIIGKTKIDFLKYADGGVVVRQGDKCGCLMALIDGIVECRTAADDGSYAVSETMHAPFVLQQDSMFGAFQQYSCTVRALSSLSLIKIEKTELLRLLDNSIIFRLNLVNSLSTKLKKVEYEQWKHSPRSLAMRIVRFFQERVLVPSGEKIFYIRITSLAKEVNDNRIRVSKALHDLQSQGLLNLYRGRIVIPAIQKLVAGTWEKKEP